MAQSSMLHVRVDETLKEEAAETLAKVGLSVSDAVRILLTCVVRDGGLPPGLTCDPATYDTWFRSRVKEALEDTGPTTGHEQVMEAAQALIETKRRAAP